jgi:hypothetical protein
MMTAELETKLKPGGYSKMGFLGPKESLEAVIKKDSRTLEKFGLSHEEVSSALEKVLISVEEQDRVLLKSSQEEYDRRQYPFPGLSFPNLYQPETIPKFSLKKLPDPNVGHLVDHLQVFTMKFRGFQACPWDCETDPCLRWGFFDFLILNRQTGKYFTGPGLIVHLIRHHHFFEGKGTPFRTDPRKVIRVLELSS